MSAAISSSSNVKKKALVFGSTGLVGKQLIAQLVAKEEIEEVFVVNRREQIYDSTIIKQEVVDLGTLENRSDLFDVDQVYICLGTTIKKAGSKAKFEEVDLVLPLIIAKMAEKVGVKHLIMISSIGADLSSSNFYLQTKGKAESQIKALNIDKVYFVRPSMLLGDRKESRLGENIAKVFMTLFSFLFIGPFKKYKAIKDTTVASAMISIMFSENPSSTYENPQLFNLAK